MCNLVLETVAINIRVFKVGVISVDRILLYRGL